MSVKQNINPNELNLTESVIKINRVAKVVKGGRRFSFSALVVAGDKRGHVGIGLGKANEVPEAIRKGVAQAKRSLIRIPLKNGTITQEVQATFGSGNVLLKPASGGTGVIAGGPVRAVVEAAGVQNILSKSLGTSNPHNVVKATMKCLEQLRDAQEIFITRGGQIEVDTFEDVVVPAAKPAKAQQALKDNEEE
ncbi:MAG: 30S ribosomal protein S5 [Bdellovibrionales bacterium]|nr:30S ribosomal protein S5 [Bdellovibrionales bacterium]